MLSKALLDQQGAEERCKQLGGHLAGYVSRLEQADVEEGLQRVVGGQGCCRHAPVPDHSWLCSMTRGVAVQCHPVPALLPFPWLGTWAM